MVNVDPEKVQRVIPAESCPVGIARTINDPRLAMVLWAHSWDSGCRTIRLGYGIEETLGGSSWLAECGV